MHDLNDAKKPYKSTWTVYAHRIFISGHSNHHELKMEKNTIPSGPASTILKQMEQAYLSFTFITAVTAYMAFPKVMTKS